jgi:cell division protein FtsZ
LRQGVQGISDIITIPGIINRDFADVRTIMAGMGYAVMGTATAGGERRTMEAAQRAIASPLLEAGAIDGARGILINITGSASLKLAEVQQACSIIQSASHEEANIIFGAVLDENMKDAVKITVIATGFKDSASRQRPVEVRTTFASAHDRAMEFPQSGKTPGFAPDYDPDFDAPRRHEPMMSSAAEPMIAEAAQRTVEEPSFSAEAAPMGLAGNGRDAISLDAMRNAMVSNFEQDDLDLPAFLRRRGEVM